MKLVVVVFVATLREFYAAVDILKKKKKSRVLK